MKRQIGVMMAVALLAGLAAAQEITLPAGTAVKMKLETPVSTSNSQAGDVFSGRVTQEVKMDEQVVIPVGAAIEGRVIQVEEPRRFRGRPVIQLRPDYVTMPDGNRYLVHAVVVETNPEAGNEVDEEGRVLGPGREGSDNRNLAIGAGGGAAIGAIAGGGKGAVIGAVIGAGTATVHWLTKRNSTQLVAGTEITMELNRPVVMKPASGD